MKLHCILVVSVVLYLCASVTRSEHVEEPKENTVSPNSTENVPVISLLYVYIAAQVSDSSSFDVKIKLYKKSSTGPSSSSTFPAQAVSTF